MSRTVDPESPLSVRTDPRIRRDRVPDGDVSLTVLRSDTCGPASTVSIHHRPVGPITGCPTFSGITAQQGYSRARGSAEYELNAFGSQGWPLIAVVNGNAIFSART